MIHEENRQPPSVTWPYRVAARLRFHNLKMPITYAENLISNDTVVGCITIFRKIWKTTAGTPHTPFRNIDPQVLYPADEFRKSLNLLTILIGLLHQKQNFTWYMQNWWRCGSTNIQRSISIIIYTMIQIYVQCMRYWYKIIINNVFLWLAKHNVYVYLCIVCMFTEHMVPFFYGP